MTDFLPEAASCASKTWYFRSPSLSSKPLRNSSTRSDGRQPPAHPNVEGGLERRELERSEYLLPCQGFEDLDLERLLLHLRQLQVHELLRDPPGHLDPLAFFRLGQHEVADLYLLGR